MQMQKLIKIIQALIALMAILLFISCQQEYININEPDKRTAITANDNVAELILKVVLQDGSYDNIIDGCNAISIQYPYSVQIKNEVIDITSIEDIQTLTLEYFPVRNEIKLIYPVTVTFSDYSESILSNAGELRKIQNQYNSNTKDDDIECIDFIYPIEITLYNTAYQKSDLIIITDDKDLHKVFRKINDLIVAITYPIQVITTDGETISINDNTELENEITKVDDNCNEDDNVEFNDEDYPYEELIIREQWEVLAYDGTNNETPMFNAYTLNFKSKNSVQVHTGKGTIHGKWELTINEKQKILKTEFNTNESPLSWLNQEWNIITTSLTIIEMERESDAEGTIRKVVLQASNK